LAGIAGRLDIINPKTGAIEREIYFILYSD